MIRFIQTSEVSGDCSAYYDVILDKPHTGWLDYEKYEYRYGVLNDAIPKNLLEKKIISITAHGGWTRMDYLLKLEQ